MLVDGQWLRDDGSSGRIDILGERALLRRFWFEFDAEELTGEIWLSIGCGVTGYDEEDCLRMIREQLIDGAETPPIRKVIPDVDVSTLDEGHVLPNMGVPVWRGIWFPSNECLEFLWTPDLTMGKHQQVRREPCYEAAQLE